MPDQQMSRIDRISCLLLCVFLFGYGMHGAILGRFYLPLRSGQFAIICGLQVFLPLLACWFVALAIMIRSDLLSYFSARLKTIVELFFLLLGLLLWVLSYQFARGQCPWW